MQRLAGLDLLRGIAAFSVLGYHVQTIFGTLPLFGHAYVAVDFFFMLSGFVMARTYELRLVGGLNRFDFMWIRVRRLWFPMAVGATVGVVAFLFSGGSPQAALPAWIALLLFLPWFAFAAPFEINRPAWSIFFELFANAAHALALRHMPIRWLITLAVTCAAILIVAGAGQNVGWRIDNFLLGFPRVLLAYSLGVALSRWGRMFDAPLMLAPAALIALFLFLPPDFDVGFVMFACPAIIVVSARGCRFGSLLGELSFPLYAIHYPVLQLAKLAGFGPMIAAVCAVLLTCCLHLVMSGWQRRRTLEPPFQGAS